MQDETGGREITENIAKLHSKQAKQREEARLALEASGPEATWYLVQALTPIAKEARHEAFKALVAIGDPSAADFFVARLDDDDADNRWLAAEGLAALGAVGLQRVLELLGSFPESLELQRSCHHALKELRGPEYAEAVAPVLKAFQSRIPAIDVPAAATGGLGLLRKLV